MKNVSDIKNNIGKSEGVILNPRITEKSSDKTAENVYVFDVSLRANKVQIKEAITKNGKLSSIAGKYEGLNLKEARKTIIVDLKENGLLLKQRPIKHDVKVHERCGTEIEYVKSVQWFVRYLDLKDEMIKWGESLTWHPDFMVHRYVNWVKGLQWDWLISRQRFFGIPFPVWYCKKCSEVKFAEEDELPVDPLNSSPKTPCKCGSNDFEPEKDVLDTWATSSLTPDIAAELFKSNKIFKKLLIILFRMHAELLPLGRLF